MRTRSDAAKIAAQTQAAEPVAAPRLKTVAVKAAPVEAKKPGKQFVAGVSSSKARRSGSAVSTRNAVKTPQTHPEWFTDDGQLKWKPSPKGWKIIPNTTGKGEWLEIRVNPRTGAKDYNYLASVRAAKEGEKFAANREFGTKLPAIRQQYAGDLKKGGRDGLIALMVALIDRTYFRVGNEESKDNGVYGVTTLLKKHVIVDGTTVTFKFIGKKKQENHKVVTDPMLAAHLKALSKRAGGDDDRLFVHDGAEIQASHLNAYLAKFGVTAKQFRTYHATRLAFTELSKQVKAPAEDREKIVDEMFERVAKQLVHTPAVCRQSYVDPAVIQAFMEGKLK